MENDELKKPLNRMSAATMPKDTSESEKVKLKESFLANLIHDLKSPIYSQIHALKILREDKDFVYNEIQKEILDQLFASCIYMRDMMDNVLLKFKSKNSEVSIEKRKNCFRCTLNSSIDNISFMFKEKGQTVCVEYNYSRQYACYDDIEIQRVLANLLSNASKYGKSDSRILIIVKEDSGNLSISIINKGKPISDEALGHVFDIYHTDCKKLKTTGTGLGLHISKKIIEAHGGKISAKNINKDTVEFNFKIPIFS